MVAEVGEASNESEQVLDSFPTLPQPRGAALGLGSMPHGHMHVTRSWRQNLTLRSEQHRRKLIQNSDTQNLLPTTIWYTASASFTRWI